MIIKPAVGGNLLIQDRAGGAVLSTGTSGATIANATLVAPALGTVASGNLSNTAIVYPTGHVIQTWTSANISGSTTTSLNVFANSSVSNHFETTVANSKMFINITLMVKGSASNGSNNFVRTNFLYNDSNIWYGYAASGGDAGGDIRNTSAWVYLHAPDLAAGTRIDYDLILDATHCTTAYINNTTSPSHIVIQEIAP